MRNGIINLNTDRAKSLGFTRDKFHGYLWKDDKYIWISTIISLNPGKGNLLALLDSIESNGFTLIIPTPSIRMKAICRKRGMAFVTSKSGYDYMEYMVSGLKQQSTVFYDAE